MLYLLLHGDEITEPTIIEDCGRSGPSSNYIPMQAGNNIHYTSGRLQKRKKADTRYR